MSQVPQVCSTLSLMQMARFPTWFAVLCAAAIVLPLLALAHARRKP